MTPLECRQYWERTLETPRYADPKRLLRYGWKAWSQADEDGILHEIFRRIGEGERTFVEFGVCARDRKPENNTTALLMTGWRGTWMEADEEGAAYLREAYAGPIGQGRLKLVRVCVGRDTIEPLLQTEGPQGELSLLSIDVDGNDYWIWEAVQSVRPRAVAIEYNATWHPPLALTVPYREGIEWDKTNYFGASLAALEKLGRRKGYALVGCSFSGVNAFFVRQDLVKRRFRGPYTAENHYEPPRYEMCVPSGHRPGIGPLEVIGSPETER